ncbi:tetratricopeptide repeat protein [Pseudoflavitalea sp. X16]|uniref:tetratricopeptide repeat protein n=1 Tax=Paraflavitalea devenefica TaxID=2716334 RepID=UPI001424941B|nr:tetratricopeptide repeat protein [Paraflavitalea devenefica]NII23880.1 tetratricopeptide repeat protein [Paraflavitalea devenefica]
MQQNVYVCNTMRQIKKLFLAFTLLSPILSWACINEYYRTEPPFVNNQLDLSAILYSEGHTYPYWKNGFQDDIVMLQRRDSLLSVGLSKLDYKSLSDYAAFELRIGDRKKAVEILEQLYEQHPNEYNIVANLGTAYEVTGNNEKALALLKKAVQINPQSHYGSEWIHVRILEQKIARKDYDKIINLGIQDFSQWIIDKQYRFPRDADSLKMQIAYQLHERIAFIPPPDDIVGQLVLDFADIVAKTAESRDKAIPFYEYAEHYGSSLQKTVAARKQVLKEEKKEVKDTFRWASVVWAIPLLAFGLILAAWLRSIRKHKSEA